MKSVRSRSSRPGRKTDASDFERLVRAISATHDALRQAAAGAVNLALTARNWAIGRYIVEYEQGGADRAEYGTAMLLRLAERLGDTGMNGVSLAALKNYRQFYLAYGWLGEAIAARVRGLQGRAIGQKASSQLEAGPDGTHAGTHGATRTSASRTKPLDAVFSLSKPVTVQPGIKPHTHSPDAALLVSRFSYSHFAELMRLDDPVKRAFYEVEGIKGAWSVPQMRRQIGSLLCERTGLSTDKRGLVARAHGQNIAVSVEDTFRDPYVLEFTGLRPHHQYSESDLESAILNHIQEFLVELGNGFCFEARQKRITINNRHDRIDLVFYHRILQCHVLIDLKVRPFEHGDAGQMNFYLNYFRENVRQPHDNPPVGLILCADKDDATARYATAGMDNKLFVSKYLSVLPAERRLLEFIRRDRDETEHFLREHGPAYGRPAMDGQP